MDRIRCEEPQEPTAFGFSDISEVDVTNPSMIGNRDNIQKIIKSQSI